MLARRVADSEHQAQPLLHFTIDNSFEHHERHDLQFQAQIYVWWQEALEKDALRTERFELELELAEEGVSRSFGENARLLWLLRAEQAEKMRTTTHSRGHSAPFKIPRRKNSASQTYSAQRGAGTFISLPIYCIHHRKHRSLASLSTHAFSPSQEYRWNFLLPRRASFRLLASVAYFANATTPVSAHAHSFAHARAHARALALVNAHVCAPAPTPVSGVRCRDAFELL
jgi:hypothetical protein